MTVSAKTPEPGWLNFALDFGPLLVFFIAFNTLGIIPGTALFMLAIVTAVIVSKLRLGRVSPMLWLSAVLVVGFGGLTIWFGDPAFIKFKPTLIYSFFAAVLIGGLLTGRPTLKLLLQAAFDGMDDRGWRKLSRNWALFFIAMAIANEVARANLTDGQWVTFKVWGVTLASLAFGMANLPMMIRHGLKVGDDEPVAAKPPEG